MGNKIAREFDRGTYAGSWVNGKPDGKGCHIQKLSYDEFVRDGEWRDGLFTGYGSYKYPDGSVYNGEWRDGKRNGKGNHKHGSCRSEGLWSNDMLIGKGKKTYLDGSVYTGDFDINLRSGQGKYTKSYKSYDSVWEGTWEYDGIIQGFYTDSFVGSSYAGEFLNMLPHGNGRMEYKSGHVQDGTWNMGKFTGNGSNEYGHIYHVSTGYYTGDYVDNIPHGQGCYTEKDTNFVCDGKWVNGRFHGNGTVTIGDDLVYTGDMVNSEAHGQGRMVQSSGQVREGSWDMGKFTGNGSVMYPDESIYIGEFVNGLKHGKGALLPNDDHKILCGWWLYNKLISEFSDAEKQQFMKDKLLIGASNEQHTAVPDAPDADEEGLAEDTLESTQ
jgi:hypothetical protein